MKIVVKETIKSSVAISSTKGEILLNEILSNLKNEATVEVDFEGVTDLTTAFLNVAIGHLYNYFSSEELNSRLIILNIDDLDKYLLSQVIERVKKNQQDDSAFRDLINEVLNDDSDS